MSGADRGREQTPPIAAPGSIAERALDGSFSGPLAGLRRRIYLTYYYLGWRTLLFRLVTFPLRFTPLQALAAAALRHRPRRLPPGGHLVQGARPARRRRDPELQGRRAGREARRLDPRNRAGGDGPRDRRRRRQRPRARGQAAPDRRDRGDRGRAQRRLRGQRQPRSASDGRRSRRGAAELRRRSHDRLAGVPAARRLGQGRHRNRRRPAAVSRRAHPVRGDRSQSGRARVVRPSLPLQARELGSGGDRRSGAGRDGGVHVHHARDDRAGGAARRVLSDGLRGRRLLPARLAGGRARDLLPGRAPLPPRVGHPRQRGGRARAGLPAGLLGALGRLLQRPRGAHARRARYGSCT